MEAVKNPQAGAKKPNEAKKQPSGPQLLIDSIGQPLMPVVNEEKPRHHSLKKGG